MQFNQLVFDQIIAEGEHCFKQKLTDAQIDQVQLFIQEFIKWNAVHNLSAVNNFETLMRAHYLDSMSVVPSVGNYLNDLDRLAPIKVADLGSGGGFPSYPRATKSCPQTRTPRHPVRVASRRRATPPPTPPTVGSRRRKGDRLRSWPRRAPWGSSPD